MLLTLQLGLVYLISELLLTITRRSRSRTGTRQVRSTLGILWLVIAGSITAGVTVARLLPTMTVFAAVALFVAGLFLRWWAIITLGRFFTVDVTIEKDHEVVERGPFQWLRHPSYSGVLLAFAGFALSLHHWIALFVILLPILAAFLYRMKVEEEALSRALGSRYTDYMRRTKRLVPFVY